MKVIVASPLAVLFLVSACTSSGVSADRLNPVNWFKTNTEAEQIEEMAAPAVSEDSRELLPVISSLEAQPFGSDGGVILIAAGVPPTFGYYDAALVPVNDGQPIEGELVYEFRAAPPVGDVEVGTEESRELTVARTLTVNELRGVETIRVIAGANEQAIKL